jgi:hypothetical protein
MRSSKYAFYPFPPPKIRHISTENDMPCFQDMRSLGFVNVLFNTYYCNSGESDMRATDPHIAFPCTLSNLSSAKWAWSSRNVNWSWQLKIGPILYLGSLIRDGE